MSKIDRAKRIPCLLVASALAIIIFLVDMMSDFNAAVAVLYPVVIVLGTIGSWQRSVYIWTAIVLALSSVSLLVVHGVAQEFESTLRFAFAVTAILLTAGLLINRLKLAEARQALEGSERRLSNFADAVPLLLFRSDMEGNASYVNAHIEAMTGKDASEIIGNDSWIDLMHPEDAEAFRRLRSETRETKKAIRLRLRMRDSEGEYRWTILDRRPMTDENDEIIEWYGFALDVHDDVTATEEIARLNKELEKLVVLRSEELKRSQHRFQTLFQDLNYAFAEMDISGPKRLLDQARAEGATDFEELVHNRPELIRECITQIRTVAVNDSLIELMGYQSQLELVSKPPTANASDAERVLKLQLQAIFEGRHHFSGTTTLVGKDNIKVPVAFGCNYMDDWTRVLSTHIDLSEQHNAHEQLLSAQADLARVNRAVTIGALSASLAHELNQPILALSLDIQSAQRWLKGEEPSVQRALAALERLSANADRVTGIVRRTRDQLTQGSRETTAVNMLQLASETRLLIDRDLSSRRVRLEISNECANPVVHADRVELQQVLVNLIMNAAEAISGMRDKSGRGLISVRIFPDGPERIVTEVTDDGPGIPDTHLPVLFEMLFTTKPDGIGMGLQICRTLIEKFGGAITARNHEAGGAVLRFSLARAQTSDASDKAGVQNKPRAQAT